MHGGTVIIAALAPPFLKVTVNVFASPGFTTQKPLPYVEP